MSKEIEKYQVRLTAPIGIIIGEIIDMHKDIAKLVNTVSELTDKLTDIDIRLTNECGKHSDLLEEMDNDIAALEEWQNRIKD